MKKALLQRICLIVLALNLLALSHASVTGKVKFDDFYKDGSDQMRLVGYGIKRFLTIKVIGAALYLPEWVSPEDALADKPKRLEVLYLQNIPKVELDRATVKGIKRNFSKEDFKRFSPKIEEINAYWPDVKKYDRIAITYYPKLGMEIMVNGDVKGVVEGKEFAYALYSIWIGKNPADQKIKAALLGKNDR